MCSWVDPSHLSVISESLGYGMPRMSPEATPLYLVIQIFFLDFSACNHHECDPDQLGMCSWLDPSHLSVISESLGYGMPRMSPEATPLHLVIQIFFLDFWACNHHECDPDQLGMCSWVDPSHLSGMSESLGYGMPRMSPEATPLYLVIQIFFLDFWACNHHECDPDQLGMCSWVDPSHLSVMSESLGYGMPRMSPEATPLYLVIQFFSGLFNMWSSWMWPRPIGYVFLSRSQPPVSHEWVTWLWNA